HFPKLPPLRWAAAVVLPFLHALCSSHTLPDLITGLATTAACSRARNDSESCRLIRNAVTPSVPTNNEAKLIEPSQNKPQFNLSARRSNLPLLLLRLECRPCDGSLPCNIDC
ncbi:unnamed protein product, partial [Ectocarpus sp. 12 AP-2014]